MYTRKLFVLLVAGLLLAACSDNPVATEEHVDSIEDLDVELTLSEDHVHTLSEITFTGQVTDHHGQMMTEMEKMQVEYRAKGADEWRSVELSPSGDHYEAAYTFMSSGEYEVRVTGMMHGGDHMEEMYAMNEYLQVGRAHVESGDYRVEFENFPGHVHDGEQATVKFWVMEAEKDASGERPVVKNLNAEIHCEDPSGATESHEASEAEDGVYHAEHTFEGAGEAHMAIHFPGSSGEEVEADFHVPVAHGH